MECSDQNIDVQAAKVEELKVEWKRLWRERFDDRVRAEGIANQDYGSLSVDKGTVIFATRNFKLLNFREILEEHGIDETFRFVQPNPNVGGWRKFISSTVGVRNKRARRAACRFDDDVKKPQQLKKGGRGWLHV